MSRALREAALEANLALPRLGLAEFTFGNASVADRARGVFAIKPSGVDYAALRAEHLVVLDFEGNVVEGTLRPSSDTPTHRRIYLEFACAGAVVHTHSRAAVAFAQAGLDLPCLGTTHADHFRGEVPVTREMTPTEVAGAYEWNTGGVIAETFRGRDPSAVRAVLVRGHGPFVWGADGAGAVELAHALEVCADMASRTQALRPDAPRLPAHLLERHFDRKHGPGSYYGQPA